MCKIEQFDCNSHGICISGVCQCDAGWGNDITCTTPASKVFLARVLAHITFLFANGLIHSYLLSFGIRSTQQHSEFVGLQLL